MVTVASVALVFATWKAAILDCQQTLVYVVVCCVAVLVKISVIWTVSSVSKCSQCTAMLSFALGVWGCEAIGSEARLFLPGELPSFAISFIAALFIIIQFLDVWVFALRKDADEETHIADAADWHYGDSSTGSEAVSVSVAVVPTTQLAKAKMFALKLISALSSASSASPPRTNTSNLNAQQPFSALAPFIVYDEVHY